MARDAHAPSLEGSRLGRYRLRFRIAQGGMASVYLAQLEGSHGFERWVAVKVIHPHLTDERRFANMLFDEARVAAKIHHPNVCAVLDFGEEDGVLFLVMEYLHGESFSSAMRRAWKSGDGMEPWFAARVTLDAAMGLHAAHRLMDTDGQSLGVVHRDVSPQNIQILYEGQSKVVDFGIARAKGRITSTDVGEVKGKLSYMAPEQVRSGAVDHRVDVWALGVVLWEATTGRRLFRTDNHATTVMNVVQMEVPPPSSVVADYPPMLERAVLGALERDPASRTASAGLLGEQLEEFVYSIGRPAGPRQVAHWMRGVFADKLSQREAILNDGDGATDGPVPDVDLVSEPSATSHVRGSAQETKSGADDDDWPNASTIPLPVTTSAKALAPRQPPPRPIPRPAAPVIPAVPAASAFPTVPAASAFPALSAPSAPSAPATTPGEETADTKSDIALPEVRAGLALAPDLTTGEIVSLEDDDDYGATVVAEPPSDMSFDSPLAIAPPSPAMHFGEGRATDLGSPPAPPIVLPGQPPARSQSPRWADRDARRLVLIGGAVGLVCVFAAVLLIALL